MVEKLLIKLRHNYIHWLSTEYKTTYLYLNCVSHLNCYQLLIIAHIIESRRLVTLSVAQWQLPETLCAEVGIRTPIFLLLCTLKSVWFRP